MKLTTASLVKVDREGARRPSELTPLGALALVAAAFLSLIAAFADPRVLVFVGFAAAAHVVRRMLAPLPRRVSARLGTDGLLVGNDFVAARDIASFEFRAEVCIVTTVKGATVELTGSAEQLRLARALVERYRTTAGAPDAEASAEALLGELARAGGGYREAAVDPARAIAILETGTALPRVRVAAAAVAARSLDPEVHVRIADAAETTAHPEVREALLAATRNRS